MSTELPTNRIKKVKLPNNTEYTIAPEILQNSGYQASLPTLSADDTLVTTSTDQTITGTKTFNSIKFYDDPADRTYSVGMIDDIFEVKALDAYSLDIDIYSKILFLKGDGDSTSLQYNFPSLSGTLALESYVEANPTIESGTTPTALSGLKIGSSYYNIASGGSNITLNNTTGSESITDNDNNITLNVVTRDTAQTISDVKTFSVSPILNNNIFLQGKNTSSVAKGLIGINSNNDVFINNDGTGTTLFGTSIRPLANSNLDVGTSTYPWRDIYLTGKVISTTNNHTSRFYQGSYYWNIDYDGTIALKGTGSVIYSKKIVPETTATYDLGSSDYNWKDIYLSGNLKSDTNYITLKNSSGNYGFYINNNLQMVLSSADLSVNGDILPRSNGTKDLGSSSYYWRNLYLAGSLRNNNATYGAVLPDMSQWSANKTLATLEDIEALPEPMVFKGGATITKSGSTYTVAVTTPASASDIKEGYTYKVTSAPSGDTNFKVGDTLIASQNNPGTNPQSHWTLIPSGDEPSGTVTSVGLSMPTGFTVSGSPVTSSGTLTATLASGYSLLNSNSGQTIMGSKTFNNTITFADDVTYNSGAPATFNGSATFNSTVTLENNGLTLAAGSGQAHAAYTGDVWGSHLYSDGLFIGNDTDGNYWNLYFPELGDGEAGIFALTSDIDSTLTNVIAPIYSGSRTYNKGDKVIYNTKFYRYKSTSSSSGHAPTDTNYWEEIQVSTQYVDIDTDQTITGTKTFNAGIYVNGGVRTTGDALGLSVTDVNDSEQLKEGLEITVNYDDDSNFIGTAAIAGGHFTAWGDNDNDDPNKPTDQTSFSDLDTDYFNTGITLRGQDVYKISFPARSGVFGLEVDIVDLTGESGS